jgi:AAA family ATPase
MSDTQSTQKTLEVKIRTLPTQERQDQKDVSRVFLSKDALLDLRLEAGQPCYIWRLDGTGNRRHEALAWPSPQKLNKNVVQMFRTFQDMCSFKLEDRIAVAPSQELQTATCVILRDTSSNGPLSQRDRIPWEWYLEKKIGMRTNFFHNYRAIQNFIWQSKSHSVKGLFEDLRASVQSRQE